MKNFKAAFHGEVFNFLTYQKLIVNNIYFHLHYCAHSTPFIQRHDLFIHCTYLMRGVESETQISTISKTLTIVGIDK